MMKYGYTGLVLAALMALPAAGQDVGDYVTIDTKLANIRSRPGTIHGVEGQLAADTLMKVVELKGGWARLTDPLDLGRTTGWINASLLRVATKPKDSFYSTLKSKTDARRATALAQRLPSPLSWGGGNFECDENLYDGGYESCDLDIDVVVRIPDIYEPYMNDMVSVSCDAEISYRRAEGFMDETERDFQSTTIYLSGGYASSMVHLSFDLGFGMDPVVSARVTDVQCSAY